MKQLELLKKQTFICKSCLRECEKNSFYLLTHDCDLCEKCFKNLQTTLKKREILNVIGWSIYPYNDFVKEKIFLLKGCGDIVMGEIFLNRYHKLISLIFKGYYIVFVPSWNEDDERRALIM